MPDVLKEGYREIYPKDWKHCLIHLSPDNITMHSDGDHSVRLWMEEKIKTNAQLSQTIVDLSEQLDKIFAVVYPNGDQWEYPGQVLNHVRQYVEELKTGFPKTFESKNFPVPTDRSVLGFVVVPKDHRASRYRGWQQLCVVNYAEPGEEPDWMVNLPSELLRPVNVTHWQELPSDPTPNAEIPTTTAES